MHTGLRIVLALIAFLTGCVALPIPHDRPVTPAISGTVRDFETGAPIVGARIEVTERPLSSKPDPARASTTSDSDGKFFLRATERATWYVIVFLAPYEGTCSGQFSVTHREYETVSFEVGYFDAANFDGVCSSRPEHRDVILRRTVK